MKFYDQIVKWGRVKPFFPKQYNFNTIDIETIGNELFMLGYTINGTHCYTLTNFYDVFHELLINCLQNSKDILTWTRYDNTHLLKLMLSKFTKKEINKIIDRIGKVTPIVEYEYKGFKFSIENIIRDSIIIKNTDRNGRSKTLTLYNLKNLYDTDLTKTAKNYHINYYSKLGKEFHIIDAKRFEKDQEYHDKVIESNRLDNIVLLDIAKQMLDDFEQIAQSSPKTIFSTGSLARSFLLSKMELEDCRQLNFKNQFEKQPLFYQLLDYAMQSYHGGKIESYVLGYIPKAKVIDITSAYPFVLSHLPKLTDKIIHSYDFNQIQKYFYAFIKCKITIFDKNFIHPVIVENPINRSNISPCGTFQSVITKFEYDYLIANNIPVQVIDFIAVESLDEYPYQKMVNQLFEARMSTKKTNPSLSQMYKIILNSLYGITFELTDVYKEIVNKKGIKSIDWQGYRAGDFFNPIIASYITSYTRTYLSQTSQNILDNGGEIYLNMTDSVIYNGECTLDVFSEIKTLGKYEPPTLVSDLYILGAGRYEYKNDFDKMYTIKSRGFSVSVKDKSFYGNLALNKSISLDHMTFITPFKSSTKKYNYQQLGYLIQDSYEINPFNLGGKRSIDNRNVDLNKEYTTTSPVRLEEDITPIR